jgi:cytochrome c oxidase subunit 3
MAAVATVSAVESVPAPHASVNRPNTVQVGTIVWLASELMFFAGLFAMYFTIRSVAPAEWVSEPEKLNIPFSLTNTINLVLSSVWCQMGVFAAEVYEYAKLYTENLWIDSSGYGSVFYLATGFHGLHVTGGLIAFLFIIGRSFAAKRFGHAEATSAIVTSYYWHFVDVVWIGLFIVIYVIQ